MDTATTMERRQLHGMWASVAPAWGEHAEYADTRGGAMTARLLELVAPGPGERVLELACGAGGTGIAAAGLVGRAGEVVLSDVAAEMTAIAAARAAALGLANVRTLTLDLDDLAQPDQADDVVLCREGLMFAFDPAHAVAEIRRVLRPGGRVAVAVWGPAGPPPGIPGPFALDDADRRGRAGRRPARPRRGRGSSNGGRPAVRAPPGVRVQSTSPASCTVRPGRRPNRSATWRATMAVPVARWRSAVSAKARRSASPAAACDSSLATSGPARSQSSRLKMA